MSEQNSLFIFMCVFPSDSCSVIHSLNHHHSSKKKKQLSSFCLCCIFVRPFLGVQIKLVRKAQDEILCYLEESRLLSVSVPGLTDVDSTRKQKSVECLWKTVVI